MTCGLQPPRFPHPIPTDTCQADWELAAINEPWPLLSEAVRASIPFLVKAARAHLPCTVHKAILLHWSSLQ